MTVNITREVISDLLPLYFSGEVSDDTARLVEAYFAQDPEFAGRARTLSESSGIGAPAIAAPEAESEKRALESARRFLRNRAIVLACALALLLAPLSFTFDGGGIRWWMLRDKPLPAVLLFLAGLVCWLLHAMMGYRARKSGF